MMVSILLLLRLFLLIDLSILVGTITTLAFFSKTHMISTGEDGKLCIWRTKDWECLRVLKGHT
jgi:hypothetical protein